MKNLIILFSLILLFFQVFSQTEYSNQWPGFRGPFAKGFVENANTVANWNLESGENILWQTSIPGLGHSCPVVWDDRMFITTAISGSGKDELKVDCTEILMQLMMSQNMSLKCIV